MSARRTHARAQPAQRAQKHLHTRTRAAGPGRRRRGTHSCRPRFRPSWCIAFFSTSFSAVMTSISTGAAGAAAAATSTGAATSWGVLRRDTGSGPPQHNNNKQQPQDIQRKQRRCAHSAAQHARQRINQATKQRLPVHAPARRARRAAAGTHATSAMALDSEFPRAVVDCVGPKARQRSRDCT